MESGTTEVNVNDKGEILIPKIMIDYISSYEIGRRYSVKPGTGGKILLVPLEEGEEADIRF